MASALQGNAEVFRVFPVDSTYSRSQTYHRGELYTRAEVQHLIAEERRASEERLQQVMGLVDAELTLLRTRLAELATAR